MLYEVITLLDRLSGVSLADLRAVAREIARLVDSAVTAKSIEECETVLPQIRIAAAKSAGLPADPESLLGPEMERYPREAPPGWKLRELGMTLKTMSLNVITSYSIHYTKLYESRPERH